MLWHFCCHLSCHGSPVQEEAGLAAPLLSHPGKPLVCNQRTGLGHEHDALLPTHGLCLSPWRGDIHEEVSALGSKEIFAKPGVTFCTPHCTLAPWETTRLPKVQAGPAPLICPLLQRRHSAGTTKCPSGQRCLPAFTKPQFGVHSRKPEAKHPKTASAKANLCPWCLTAAACSPQGACPVGLGVFPFLQPRWGSAELRALHSPRTATRSCN